MFFKENTNFKINNVIIKDPPINFILLSPTTFHKLVNIT